jgi:hypothetical protein
MIFAVAELGLPRLAAYQLASWAGHQAGMAYAIATHKNGCTSFKIQE